MTAKPFFNLLSVLVLTSIPIYAQAEIQARPATSTATVNGNRVKALPSFLSSPVKNGNIDEVQKLTLEKIKVLSSEKDADSLLQDEQYRQLVAIAEIIRVSGPAHMSKFVKDDPKAGVFLHHFLSNTEWMELYLGAGLVPEDTDAGLKVLAAIWYKHGKDSDFDSYLSLTSGLASFWAAGRYAEEIQLGIGQGETKRDPVRRYEFFRKQHKAGKLHGDFLKLRPWEIRFVVGSTYDDASFEWVAKNVNIPPRRYTDACWFAEYTGTNFFGESIQGPLFYVPWRAESNDAETVKMRGGVCGSLSHLGAISAMAHGIPAYTVGQPGHCAYGVRLKRGEWEGGFGGPDGGMHNYIFGHQAPTSFLLMEKVYADDNTIDKAYRYSFHARAMEAIGKPDLATKGWEKALDTSPVHPFFRQELHRLYAGQGDMKPQDWYAYAQKALPAYEGNGFAAIDIFGEAESNFIREIPEESRLKWFKTLHETLSKTPTSWALKFDGILDKQIGNLDSDKAREQFLVDVFSIHLNHGDGTNFGQSLEWAVKTFVESGREDIFSKAFAQAAASGSSNVAGNLQIDPDKLKNAYGKAIVAAEMAHSRSAFQALSKAAAQFASIDPQAKTFSSDPLPGKLVPPTGLVRISTTSGWDRPAEHLYMLMPCGGFCHTDKEATPNIIVELPGTVKLSGLLVSKQDGSQDRMKKMVVSTSTDGQTWFPLEETPDMPKEWRIEPKKDTQARWIKIEAHNEEPNFMHLKHILVYQH